MLVLELKRVINNKQVLFHAVYNHTMLKTIISLYIAGCFFSWFILVMKLLSINLKFDLNFLNTLYFYFFFVLLFYITIKGYNRKEVKYNNFEIKPDGLKEVYEKILNCMTEKQPFLEPDINLKEFSEIINVSPRMVSQAINHFFGSNYNDFMNHHRVEQCKKRLREMPDMNIQEIMYASGFNSKATFNKVFKNLTDTTPKLYRQKVLENKLKV